jgi:hypothetical protein
MLPPAAPEAFNPAHCVIGGDAGQLLDTAMPRILRPFLTLLIEHHVVQ